MAVMRTVGNGHQLPAHACVREDDSMYIVKLDLSDFNERELNVEALGRVVTVRAKQFATKEDEGLAFRLCERLEESFRFPDDADIDGLKAMHQHGSLELRAPKLPLERRSVPVEHPSPYAGNPLATAC
jgi:HSP20 family molecular chaperone IbpA